MFQRPELRRNADTEDKSTSSHDLLVTGPKQQSIKLKLKTEYEKHDFTQKKRTSEDSVIRDEGKSELQDMDTQNIVKNENYSFMDLRSSVQSQE